ncbi:hypothetical protein [Alteromonas sp. H39]
MDDIQKSLIWLCMGIPPAAKCLFPASISGALSVLLVQVADERKMY